MFRRSRRADHEDSSLGGLAGLVRPTPFGRRLRPNSRCADKAHDIDAVHDHLADQGIETSILLCSYRIVRGFDHHQHKTEAWYGVDDVSSAAPNNFGV